MDKAPESVEKCPWTCISHTFFAPANLLNSPTRSVHNRVDNPRDMWISVGHERQVDSHMTVDNAVDALGVDGETARRYPPPAWIPLWTMGERCGPAAFPIHKPSHSSSGYPALVLSFSTFLHTPPTTQLPHHSAQQRRSSPFIHAAPAVIPTIHRPYNYLLRNLFSSSLRI